MVCTPYTTQDDIVLQRHWYFFPDKTTQQRYALQLSLKQSSVSKDTKRMHSIQPRCGLVRHRALGATNLVACCALHRMTSMSRKHQDYLEKVESDLSRSDEEAAPSLVLLSQHNTFLCTYLHTMARCWLRMDRKKKQVSHFDAAKTVV